MMVLGVNSKRQRRPNVRLGEIGDVSAANSYRNSWKLGENREEKNLKHERKSSKETTEMDFQVDCGFPLRKSSFPDSEPGVSPRLDAHNRENKNPNSIETVSQFTNLETDVTNAKLDFGKVTRKSRGMKRRSMREHSSIGSTWNSRFSSEIANEDGKLHGDNAAEEPTSNAFYDVYTIKEFNDPLDRETSELSKHAYENELAEHISDMNVRNDSDEFWTENDSKEGNGFSSDDTYNKISEVQRTGNGGAAVPDVSGWLEEMGFEKYAGIFEMHEVDGEVLPLLTFEDLKEMGINAVGPRRKLFTAIQRLKDGPVR